MQQFYSMRCDAMTSLCRLRTCPWLDGALPLEQWRWSREVLCALAAGPVYIYICTYNSICQANTFSVFFYLNEWERKLPR